VARDYLGGHPARPVLVVEVADSSLACWRYESVETFRPPASVRPLARPGARVAVVDLLP